MTNVRNRIKTISTATAIAATLGLAALTVQAAPANIGDTDTIGHGPVLNGMRLNGIRLNGLVLNGLVLNGPVLNGPVLNGLVLNGLVLNGPVLNGPVLNGPVLNGPVLNGPVLNGAATPVSLLESNFFNLVPQLSVQNKVGVLDKAVGQPVAVTLPSGETLVLR